MSNGIYTSGEYFKNNPTWGVDDSPWKAKKIIKMMERNNIAPKIICEVGCGAGEILSQLQKNMVDDCVFYGYEISPQAFELCQKRANKKLRFELTDFRTVNNIYFDIILLIDIIEHLEDYFTYLREIKSKGQFKLFKIPLEITVLYALRSNTLTNNRKLVGHLHYFTKDLALQMLQELDYEVLDHFFCANALERPGKFIRRKIANIPRKFLSIFNEDLAARILGGYSLMVLTK
jgi:cyclopropane fatty-acyl-phospholipid synthase-like methyltransferase